MAAPSVDDLGRSFERYLRAANRSPRTIETDLEAVRGFAAHLAGTSGRALDQARREDVEAWIVGAGLQVLEALMEESVDALAGPKGKHDRTGPRCATATSGAR
jgi:hypothetical protein